MEPIINVINLSKIYDNDVLALDDVSFQFSKPGVYGLLGANGAGKTTLIRILTGILKPTVGQAFIHGIPVSESHEILREKIGVLPQDSGLYEELTITENLSFIAKLRGFIGDAVSEEVERVIKLVGLEKKADTPVSTLSGGMKRRGMVARALIGNPPVLFFDEPTIGLDVLIARKIRKLIKNLAKEKTLVLATHNMFEAYDLCDEVLLMQKGKLIRQATPNELLKEYGERNDTFEDVVAKLLELEAEEDEE